MTKSVVKSSRGGSLNGRGGGAVAVKPIGGIKFVTKKSLKEEIITNTSEGWPNSHPTECVCEECRLGYPMTKKSIEEMISEILSDYAVFLYHPLQGKDILQTKKALVSLFTQLVRECVGEDKPQGAIIATSYSSWLGGFENCKKMVYEAFRKRGLALKDEGVKG